MTSNATEINVAAPSSSLRSYTSRSGLYRVAFPSNWQVYEEGSTGATIAPQGGIGEINGRTEVVYGAVINHYEPFNNAAGQRYLRGGGSSNITLDNATNDLLNQIVQNSPHLKVINGSAQRMNVNGGQAIAASLRGTNPNTGIIERVTVVTRQLADDHLVYMLFVTPDRDASKYKSTLNAMVRSIEVNEEARH